MRMAMVSLLAALSAAPAQADDTWKTDFGQVMWEKDYAGGAVFRVETGKGKFARFYIEGLRADDTERGHFNGYWINTADDDMCSASLTGPDGATSRTWGRLSLTFVDKAFPSQWVMLTGDCMAEPAEALVGKPEHG